MRVCWLPWAFNLERRTKSGVADESEAEDDAGNAGEVLPDGAPMPPAGNSQWLALVSNYTERPDLLIDALERADPGFVARMNAATEKRAERTDEARFKFGERQAYAGLTLSWLGGAAILGLICFHVAFGEPTFWAIFALGIVYAITQSGTAGMARFVETIARIAGRNDGP